MKTVSIFQILTVLVPLGVQQTGCQQYAYSPSIKELYKFNLLLKLTATFLLNFEF